MMSYFNSRRWLAILVIILVALNIGTVTAFWLLRDKRGAPPAGQGNPTAFLVKELGLDSVQRDKLDLLIAEHRRAVMQLRDENREAKDAFFARLGESSISDSALAVAAREANRPDQEIEVATFRHFQQVRALCNAAQQKKFDEIIQEVLRMNAGGRGPQGGPPPDRDGPPPRRE